MNFTSFIEQVQVDAFALKAFSGNPAAVVFEHKEDQWMQGLANENNLAETAFLSRRDDAEFSYNLRWFTPNKEVDLCGHATLASAHALYESKRILNRLQRIQFHTLKSGILSAVGKPDGTIELDFPATPPTPHDLADAGVSLLTSALGINAEDIVYVGRSAYDLFVELKVGAFGGLGAINYTDLEYFGGRGVIITCRGGGRLSESDEDDVMSRQLNKDNVVWNKQYDFLSRFFAPRYAVNEDPVTGSAHCALAPYWFAKYSNESTATSAAPEALVGYQASARGGVVNVALSSNEEGDRVLLSGNCITTIHSKIVV